MMRLECRVQAATAEADGRSREGDSAGPQTSHSWKKRIGAASAQIYCMMLVICKGAALNVVFLAGDNGCLEA